MKSLLRSPLYLLFVLAACGYLGAANLQGWSLFAALAMAARGTPGAHGAPIRHK
jgi:hypothetical protein